MNSSESIWTNFILPVLVWIAGTLVVFSINEISVLFKAIIFLFVLVIVVVYYIPKDTKNTKINSNIVRLILILLIISVIGLAIFASLRLMPDKPTISTSLPMETGPSPQIRINYNSDTARIQEVLTGTARNIPERYELWILVYPYAAKKYYPQNGNVYIENNGDWSIPIGIGTMQNLGEKFDILAVLADNDARAEFTAYMEKAKMTTDWPGMDKIPDGAKVYDRITVVRKYEETTVTRETPEAPIQKIISNLLPIITNIFAIFASVAVVFRIYLSYRTNKNKIERK